MNRNVGLALLFASLLFPRLANAEPVRKRVPIAVQGQELGSVVFAQLALKVEETGEVSGLKDQYVQLFNDALRKAGYEVPGAEKSVFKAESLPDTDYILAGALTGFDCSDEEGVTCGITVEWELLDRQKDTVVYRMTAKHEEKGLQSLSGEASARALLLGTLDSLMARQRFSDALRKDGGTAVKVSEPAYESQTIKRCAVEPAKMPKGSDSSLNATVVIKVKDGIGSGVIISPDGFLLTAAHVATDDVVDVRFRSGEIGKAEVIRIDEAHDVALLRLREPAKAKTCLALDSSTPKPGEDVFVLGSPAGEELSFSVTRGIVSGMRTFNGTSYLQTDAPINPGNSGGPLVSEEGKVLAIASWKVVSENMEGLGFGVPSSTVLNSLAIRLGDETDTIAARVSRGTNTASAFADTADPNFWYVGDNAPGKTPGWVGALRGWGWLTASIGGGVVLTSWLLSLGNDVDSFGDYRTANTVGWIAVGAGAGMIISSYVFKPTKRPPPEVGAMPYTTPVRPEITGGLGPTSVSFQIKF